MERQKPQHSPLDEDHTFRWVICGLLAVLIHLGIFALLPLLSRDASDDPMALYAQNEPKHKEEEIFQVVEEPEEEVVEPEIAEPHKIAPPKNKPPEPSPKPSPRTPPPLEPNMLAIDQPLQEKEEVPDKVTALGSQDRKVEVETQPKERSLTPGDSDTLKKDQTGQEQSSPASKDTKPRPNKVVRGKKTNPLKAPKKAQDKKPTDSKKETVRAPRKASKAQKKGKRGEAGASNKGAGAVNEVAEGTDGALQGSKEEGKQDKSGSKQKDGESGSNAKADVAAALKIDLGQYDKTFGERDAIDKARLSGRERKFLGRWRKRVESMKAAMENFVPNVRYGNQIAINTRRSVYASYLARIHRKIHRLWGGQYLHHLDLNFSAGHPLSNPRLLTKVEMVIDGKSGEVKEVVIVDSSRNYDYDTEAVRVSLVVSPHGPAPRQIVSPDGNVYVHWRFWRDTRQCGTFGASVFVVDNTGKIDQYEVKEGLDDLNEHHPRGSKPGRHRHGRPGPKLE